MAMRAFALQIPKFGVPHGDAIFQREAPTPRAALGGGGFPSARFSGPRRNPSRTPARLPGSPPAPERHQNRPGRHRQSATSQEIPGRILLSASESRFCDVCLLLSFPPWLFIANFSLLAQSNTELSHVGWQRSNRIAFKLVMVSIASTARHTQTRHLRACADVR